MRRALEAAGVEFTNGSQPGVRATPLWMLHRVAERANLDDILKMNGRHGFWKFSPTAAGLECKNQHNEIIGRVVAGQPDHPTPKFDPDVGELTFPDRVTPTELHRWITEMLMRDRARGPAARAFDLPVVSGEDLNTEDDGGAGARLKKKGKRNRLPRNAEPPEGCLIGHKQSLRKPLGWHWQPWSNLSETGDTCR